MIASFWRLIRYHLGTAAFGSLIIAIIQMIRLILAYVQYMVNKYKNKGGAASRAAAKVAECILCCLQCILDCFERFMKFINMNAYIETAIYGYNFCRAAMKAFQLLVSKKYFLFTKLIHHTRLPTLFVLLLSAQSEHLYSFLGRLSWSLDLVSSHIIF